MYSCYSYSGCPLAIMTKHHSPYFFECSPVQPSKLGLKDQAFAAAFGLGTGPPIRQFVVWLELSIPGSNRLQPSKQTSSTLLHSFATFCHQVFEVAQM